MKDQDKADLNVIDRFTQDAMSARTFVDVVDYLEIALKNFSVTGFGYWSFPRNCLNMDSGKLTLENAPYFNVFRGPVYLKAAEKFYFDKKIFESDPTLAASSLATTAVTTSDILKSHKGRKANSLINAFMRKFGIGRDLILPIHTARRIQALWVFSIFGANVDFKSEAALLQQLADRFAIAASDFVALKTDEGTQDTLTTREAQCILLIARGYSNTEIAADLEISVHSVKFHMANTMQKLGAANRSEAIAKAARAGLLKN